MQPGEGSDLAAFDFTAPKDIHLHPALPALSNTVPLLGTGCVWLSRQTERLVSNTVSVSTEIFADRFSTRKGPIILKNEPSFIFFKFFHFRTRGRGCGWETKLTNWFAGLR